MFKKDILKKICFAFLSLAPLPMAMATKEIKVLFIHKADGETFARGGESFTVEDNDTAETVRQKANIAVKLRNIEIEQNSKPSYIAGQSPDFYLALSEKKNNLYQELKPLNNSTHIKDGQVYYYTTPIKFERIGKNNKKLTTLVLPADTKKQLKQKYCTTYNIAVGDMQDDGKGGFIQKKASSDTPKKNSDDDDSMSTKKKIILASAIGVGGLVSLIAIYVGVKRSSTDDDEKKPKQYNTRN